MRFAITLIMVAFNIGCQKRDNEEVDDPITKPSAALVEKGGLYCQLEQPRYEERGYVVSECDGSGFTSLHSLNCPNIDLSVFVDAEGKLFRSPGHRCFEDGKSKSQSSRDMHLMRMVAAFEQKDLNYINNTIQYGEDHNWVMCEAINDTYLIGRCTFTPGLISLLYDIRTALSSTNLVSQRIGIDYEELASKTKFSASEIEIMLAEQEILPPKQEAESESLLSLQQSDDGTGILPLKQDFEAHLEAVATYLSGRVHRGITNTELGRMKAYAERESQNGLYNVIPKLFQDGDFEKGVALLEDTNRFPAEALPTNHGNYCTEYLYQRNMLKDGAVNPDWQKCEDEEPVSHSATEFGFTLFVMKRAGK